MGSSALALAELTKIVELFSSKELPDICARSLIDSPMKPSSKWSLGNILLMFLAGTTDARGFRQWQEVNRHVKKGVHAFYILAPMIKKKTVKDEETGEEKEEEFLVGFKGVPVFRIEDTEGEPLPEYKPRDIPPLTDVAERWGVQLKYDRQPRAAGSFRPDTNTITLGSEDWDVFFHELAHKAHSTIEKLKPQQDPEQETVAQLTAATLCRLYGRNADNISWNYIAQYAGKKSPEAVGRLCLRVLGKVQKIIQLILETSTILVPTSGKHCRIPSN